jgi:hypothetical protein
MGIKPASARGKEASLEADSPAEGAEVDIVK